MDLAEIKKLISQTRVSVRQVLGLEKRLADLEAAPPGSVAWGSIGGTLADQTDLAAAIPDQLSDLTADATHRLVTDTEKGTWNGKQDALEFTAENVANKDTTTTLGTSDTKYPSQKAVKTYVDTEISGVSGGGVTAIASLINYGRTGAATNYAGYSFRNVIPANAFSVAASKIRVGVWAMSNATLSIANVSVVVSTTPPDGDVAPTEILFSGGSGCTIPNINAANSYPIVWSDWTAFSWVAANQHLLILDVTNSGTQKMPYVTVNGFNIHYKAASVSYNIADVDGYTAASNYLYGIAAIELAA